MEKKGLHWGVPFAVFSSKPSQCKLQYLKISVFTQSLNVKEQAHVNMQEEKKKSVLLKVNLVLFSDLQACKQPLTGSAEHSTCNKNKESRGQSCMLAPSQPGVHLQSLFIST